MEKTELEKRMYHRFGLKCKKCGHVFLPWHSLGVTNEKTGWKDAFFCPGCHTLQTKDEYISGI